MSGEPGVRLIRRGQQLSRARLHRRRLHLHCHGQCHSRTAVRRENQPEHQRDSRPAGGNRFYGRHRDLRIRKNVRLNRFFMMLISLLIVATFFFFLFLRKFFFHSATLISLCRKLSFTFIWHVVNLSCGVFSSKMFDWLMFAFIRFSPFFSVSTECLEPTLLIKIQPRPKPLWFWTVQTKYCKSEVKYPFCSQNFQSQLDQTDFGASSD